MSSCTSSDRRPGLAAIARAVEQPIEADRDAPVGGSAVGERIEEEAEPIPGLLCGEADELEDARLDVRPVDADRAARQQSRRLSA